MDNSFYERVNFRVNTTPTTVPLDVALLGMPIDEAVCIDIDQAVRLVAPTESEAGDLSFSELTEARVPVNSNNVFIQFQTDSAEINSEFPGWLGIHIVPFSTARKSRLFGMLEQIPERVDLWHDGYAMVIYREWPSEISLAPAGMLIGLNDEGGIIDAAMFGIMEDDHSGEKSWDHVSHLTAWIVYLTFCVFTMVNQGEALLQRKGPGRWQV